MKVIRKRQFLVALKEILRYIALDKPSAAENFLFEFDRRIDALPENPFLYRKSIYFDDEKYRDLVFMGYTVIYRVDSDAVRVLEIFKWVER